MTDELVEKVATMLAPYVCRPVHSGDCDDIAAGQSHARYVARAVIPLIYNQAIEDAAKDVSTWFPPGTEGHPNYAVIASVRALAKP